ncbi:hypothetical protein DGWBC_1176 [Dehalogenimonas sp. WBC-2]|nr:hypothetical protein DGWBC_1176 [Dehalogenimonas sp. WBC-2]
MIIISKPSLRSFAEAISVPNVGTRHVVSSLSGKLKKYLFHAHSLHKINLK